MVYGVSIIFCLEDRQVIFHSWKYCFQLSVCRSVQCPDLQCQCYSLHGRPYNSKMISVNSVKLPFEYFSIVFMQEVFPCMEDQKISFDRHRMVSIRTVSITSMRAAIGVGHRANSPTFPKERLKIKARGRSRTCVPIEQPTSGTNNL